MPRVRNSVATRRRRKKILKMARGARGGRSKLFKNAKETVKRGLQYAYRDRRQRKRMFRRLWVVRINAAVRALGMKYSDFIHGLGLAGLELDRKVLADIALEDPAGFTQLAEKAKAAISQAA